MDRSIDPCVDFYKYACGAWSKQNPIPPDRTAWMVYSKAYEDNLALLHNVLEQAATAKSRDSVTQKVGDFYTACMDETTANQRGLSAIKPELDGIHSIQSVNDLAAVVAHLQLVTSGSSMMFGSGSEQDPDDTEKQIASLDQGGIGLPNRDYYTQQDAKSKEIRQHYLQHVQKIFEITRRFAGQSQTKCCCRNADRNQAGQGVLDRSGAPRSLQVKAQNESARP